VIKLRRRRWMDHETDMEILNHLGIDWRMILKMIITVWQVGVDWFNLAQDRWHG
jgi:hypothetical protein